jgi:hypothetical protein
MQVIDLIIQLQKFPGDMEVYVDVTSEHSTMFHLKPIETCEELETEMLSKKVVIISADGL